jgi:hypothetical protein
MPPSAAAGAVAYEAISRLKSDAWMSSFDGHTLKALGVSLTSGVGPFPNSESCQSDDGMLVNITALHSNRLFTSSTLFISSKWNTSTYNSSVR